MSKDRPPANYCFTVIVGLFIAVGLIITLLVQLAAAVVLVPLLLCPGGRQRFQTVHSFLLRGLNGLIGSGLNPFWCTQMTWLGEDAGPPRGPEGSMGSIIFVNHRSNADAWFSAWALSRACIEARYVYKSSLNKIPLLGWCMVWAGDLSVEAGDKSKILDMLDRAKELVRSGRNVLVFPEGTRSPSGILQEFKPGFFRVCAELGCPAVPMVMLGTERAWPLSGLKLGCASVQVCMGQAIYPNQLGGGAEALMAAMEERMTGMAREVLRDSKAAFEVNDPFLTGRPYAYWQPPAGMEDISEEERIGLLRSGKAHDRGKHLF